VRVVGGNGRGACLEVKEGELVAELVVIVEVVGVVS